MREVYAISATLANHSDKIFLTRRKISMQEAISILNKELDGLHRIEAD